jgi:hypothetical protein
MYHRLQGRAGVPKIVTQCPVTGQPIETGIEIDEVSFALLPDFTSKVFCFHCHAEHEWSKQTASVIVEERSES